MTTWSEGPWEFSAGGIWAFSPWHARVKIADVTTFSPMNGIDSAANGRLMSASRDLYEALDWAISDIESRTIYTSAEQHKNCLEKAKAALAKAAPRTELETETARK